MEFKDILDTTKFSTSETAELLRPLFENSGQLNEIVNRQQEELLKLKEKYPSIPNINVAMSIMKLELSTYAKKLLKQ